MLRSASTRGYKTFIELKQKYPDYTFFTANNLREYDYYPETLPQLYFYKEDEYGERTEYMLDIFTNDMFFYIKKRIDQYLEHYGDGEWKRKQYPTIMFIVPDSRLKAKATKYFNESRDNVYADEEDIPFKIITATALKNINTVI